MSKVAPKPPKIKGLTKAQSLALALSYTAMNPRRRLLPVKPGAKFPPLIKNYLVTASADEKQLRTWANLYPGCNWGLALKGDQLIVVDVDTKEGKSGEATYADLDLEYGWPEPTEEVRTPSGGRHQYYEGEHVFALGEHGFGLNIDSPNYVLIAGCQFANGTCYESVRESPVAKAPSWFYDVLSAAKAKHGLSDAGEMAIETDKPANVDWAIAFLKEDAEPAIEGKGGEFQTLKIAMGVRDKGISPELCLALMLEYYSPRCIPPWDAEGLEIKVKNAYSYASQSRGGDRTAELDFEEDRDFDSSAIVPFGDPKDIAKQKRARTKARKAEAEKPEGQKAQTDWSKAKFIEQFVYVGGDFDRFLKKADPRIRWKRGVIDAHFKFLFSKGKVSDNMLSNKTGTVARYECVGYKPGAGQDLEGGRMFNLYRPSSVIPKEGDISWWQDHLAFLFPDELDRRMLTNWLAWFVQNLDKKPKHALLIQGRIQGTGKSFISNMLTKIIGEHNQSVVSQGALRGDFNGYAMRAKLLVIEELRAVERNEVKTALHDIITEERITINEKGIPRFNMENFFGLIAMTNEDAAISLDLSDRRYLVLRTDAMKRTPEYYDALYAKLRDPEAIAAVAHHLMTHDCGNYSGAAAAPVTEAKGDMILAGAGDHARYIEENIGTWPSVMTLPEIRELLQRANIKVGDRAIGKALEILDAVKWGKKRGSDSIRPFGRNGRKLYPWLLGEAAAKAKAGKKFTESEVIGMYLASHSVTGETKHTAAGIVADNDDDLADLLGADAPSTRRPTLN